MNSPAPENSSEGTSPVIKISVIILTVVTIIAFAFFFYKLISRLPSPSSGQPQSSVYKTVGDRLRADGLAEQAIGQYKIILSQDKVNSQTRAQISQSVGELYAEMNDCGEALVWFYHAEAAGPSAENKPALESVISQCKDKRRRPETGDRSPETETKLLLKD